LSYIAKDYLLPFSFKIFFSLPIFPAIFSGLSVPIMLGVWADLLLLFTGAYGLITLVKNWKLIGKG